MTVFNSKINPNSEQFAANRREMLALIDKLAELNGRGATISAKRQARVARTSTFAAQEAGLSKVHYYSGIMSAPIPKTRNATPS